MVVVVAIPNHHSLLFGHTVAWPSHLYLRSMFDVSLIGFMAPGMKKFPNLMPDVYLRI